MAESTGLRQFFILLYKGLLLRKRHYIVTFFEIIVPILIASIPCIIKSEAPSTMDAPPENPHWINQTIYAAFDPFTTMSNSFYNDKNLDFLYAPANDLTSPFMNDSIAMFKSKTNFQGQLTPKGFKTEEEMVNYYIHQKGDDFDYLTIGTVLNNFQDRFPKSLVYKIRYGGGHIGPKFSTDMKYRVNGPHTDNEYRDSYFLAWQSAVEEMFIQKKATEHGKVTELKNFKIWMRTFPYPQRSDTKLIVKLGNNAPLVLNYAYLIFVMNMVRRIIEEKANRSKELLKMMGMTNFTYWASIFANYFVCGFITIFFIAILYKIPMKNGAVFVNSMDFLLLIIVLVLFMVNLILFCMALSVFFNQATFGVTALLLIYVPSVSLLAANFFYEEESQTKYFLLPGAYKVAICLIPQGALLTAFSVISAYEAGGEGVQWNNLTEFLIAPNMNMLRILLIMLLSCLIYIAIIWYFDAVWPWQPGVP
ncbi:unnamed protein product, partial [Larinioides sclopetarius]